VCVQRGEVVKLFPADFSEQLRGFLVEAISKEIETSKIE